MAEEKVRRKPGRPRKTPIKEPARKQGITKEPSKSEHVVETLYDKPQDFKKLTQYWKSLDAEKILFSFTPHGLVLATRDYKSNNWVRVRYMGDKVTNYYCKVATTFVVLFDNLDCVLQRLDKAYESIAFVLTRAKKDKIMYIVLQNEFEIPESFDIDLCIDPAYAQSFNNIFDEVPYPLEFKLPGKYFKKTIGDLKNFDEHWVIQKDGKSKDGKTNPLMFTFRSVNGQVRGRNIIKDARKNIIADNLKEHELFVVTVLASTLKATSSALLADVVNFKADQDRPLWIWADIGGGAIFVDVIVSIVNYKQREDGEKDGRDGRDVKDQKS